RSEELRRERGATDDELSRWVATLDAERLAGPLEFVRRGELQSSPLWWSVIHLFNHQTHHRGQVTTLLMQQGIDPGVTDLIAMLRAQAGRASRATSFGAAEGAQTARGPICGRRAPCVRPRRNTVLAQVRD